MDNKVSSGKIPSPPATDTFSLITPVRGKRSDDNNLRAYNFIKTNSKGLEALKEAVIAGKFSLFALMSDTLIPQIQAAITSQEAISTEVGHAVTGDAPSSGDSAGSAAVPSGTASSSRSSDAGGGGTSQHHRHHQQYRREVVRRWGGGIGGGAVAGGGSVVTPMPGRVVKVCVEEGEEVARC